MTNNLPVRLIVCVNGTWCGPDGAHGNRDHNITNVYRFYTSIKKGDCDDGSGKRFHQIKKYYPGIAAEDGLATSDRILAGIHGGPCIKQIRDVYEFICQSSGPNDEIWLYGFSRGAYVVRAVAGLLHYMRAISSAGEVRFKGDFKLALKVYKTLQQQNNLGEGQKHHLFEASTKPAATIQFVGVFDTVKEVQDEGLYDISFNPSIQHMRHALALNEDRRRFEPEYIYPNFNNRTQILKKRTFVQAWFVGAHIDIGGSADKDGLSLYPLQWMLIESKNHGLLLEFDGDFGRRSTLTSLLKITGLDGNDGAWECTTKNGLVIQMTDITNIHEDKESKGRYSVHIHRTRGSLWVRRYREPFQDNGQLNGYCSFGAQGTIIHPSVYLMLDKFMHTNWHTKEFPFYKLLHQWRSNTLGKKDDLRAGCFWNEPGDQFPEESGAIRVLVCGNYGVGKSSLINKVFGVEVTTVAHRTRGIHQIDEELRWKDRPDLVIHDSGGFEVGGQDELSCVQNFLKRRSAEWDFKERLHVIWYCFQVSDSRLQQTAQNKLFKSLSEYADDVPLVAIATKKDAFFGEMRVEAKRVLQQRQEPVTEEDLDRYAERELEVRLQQIDRELKVFGRFDDLVAISIHDEASIGNLSLATSQLFNSEKVRLLYIRAQATRLDLKIDLALEQTIKIYKRILVTSSAMGAIPGAMTTIRTVTAIDLCRAIITSFGISTIAADTIFSICEANIWDDFSNDIRTSIAKISALYGVGLVVLSAAMPFVLIPVAASAPLIVLATAQLVLMLACDIILILTRAFREAALKSIAKPEKRDVESAAVEYRKHYREVHLRIKKELPHAFRCFKIGEIESLMISIIEEFKCKVLEGLEEPLPPNFRRDYLGEAVSSVSSDDSSHLKDGCSDSDSFHSCLEYGEGSGV